MHHLRRAALPMIYEERSVLVSDTSDEPVTIQGKALAATLIAPTGSKD